jgi:uncharacterized protein (TIGR03085 family)
MTSATTPPAQAERRALSDLMLAVGPDAPTLCGDWTTRDLAAHLVMRDRRPDGAIGIVVSSAAGYAEKVQESIAATEWTSLVDQVRSGPPIWSPVRIPAVDRLVNTVEFFVHHEDVRRAADPWEARELDPELVDGLYTGLKMARRLVKSSDVGIVLEPTDDRAPITAKAATPTVTVSGPVEELLLFVYGRQPQSRVELAGDEAAIDAVQTGSFGI